MRRPRVTRPPRLSLVVVAAIAMACGQERLTSPAHGPVAMTGAHASRNGASSTTDDPSFVSARPSAPGIANPVISFWAKRGVDRTIRMVYQSRPGHNDSTTFLAFRVRAQSLIARPDGTPLAIGDSVEITVRLVDTLRLQVDFQPAGLRFAASHPATLKLSYAETTAASSTSSSSLRIWRQETPVDPWLPVPSRVLEDANEVQSDIGGFTGYAVAY